MRHLEEGTIHAWLDGALSGDEAARVEAHTRQCAECAAAVGEARGLIAGASRIVSALDVVPAGVIPRPKPAPEAAAPKSLWRVLRFTPSRAAIAATLLVAVGSMFVQRYAVPHGDNESASLESVVVASPAPAVPPSAPPPQPQAQAASDARHAATDVAKVGEQKKESRGMSPREMSAAVVAAEAGRGDAPSSSSVLLLDRAEPVPAIIGCFLAAEDPARIGIALPLRFSLDTSGNLLRKLDDSGRAESVAGEWRQTSAESVLITLANRDQRTVVSLTRDGSGALAVTTPSLGSRSAADGSSRSISVSRMDCAR